MADTQLKDWRGRNITPKVPTGGGGGGGYAPSIKILHIGNSYTKDATSYIAPLLTELLPNVDVTIGILYNAGCSLQKYHEEIFPSGITQTFEVVKNKAWQATQANYSVTDAFNDESWDIVTYQQKSGWADDYQTYQPYLRQNIKTVSDLLPKNCKNGWFIGNPQYNSSDYGVAKFEGAASAAQKVLEESACEFILPCGTAIQNLRTIPAMRELGGQGGLQDSDHLATGLGMLAEGYVYILWLAKLLGLPVGVYNSKYRPVRGDAHTTHGGYVPIGTTDENCRLAQIAAAYAIKFPLSITDMNDEVESSQ